MSSNNSSGDWRLDLDLDLVTTPEDVRVLRALRSAAPSWLTLTAEQLDALLPDDVLDRRCVATGRAPFSLEPR